jgi:hypothetical protein
LKLISLIGSNLLPAFGIPSIVRAGLWSWGIVGGDYDSFYAESNATKLGLKYW